MYRNKSCISITKEQMGNMREVACGHRALSYWRKGCKESRDAGTAGIREVLGTAQ